MHLIHNIRFFPWPPIFDGVDERKPPVHSERKPHYAHKDATEYCGEPLARGQCCGCNGHAYQHEEVSDRLRKPWTIRVVGFHAVQSSRNNVW